MKSNSEFSEAECLGCWPFESDFGISDDRVLKDKFVTARVGGKCHWCAEDIRPGSRIRTMAAVFDGELMSFRWCNACCASMVDNQDEFYVQEFLEQERERADVS